MTRNEQIIDMRRHGVGPHQISRRMKLTIGTVMGVLFRAGWTSGTGSRAKGPTDEVKRAAAKLADERTLREASVAYGVSIRSISRWKRDVAA